MQGLGNSTAPDKGIGFNLTIPLRNRTAQADQARSLIEYRQSELRLEQLYTQIRMQVVNAQFALTNDRAQVQAAIAARDYNKQSLDAEVKKLRWALRQPPTGAATAAQPGHGGEQPDRRQGAYAKDRAGLYQTLATTLQHYGINLNEAATGDVKTAPVVPGLEPAKPSKEPSTAPPAQ